MAGASGTIGRAVVRACLADEHRVLAQLRTAPAEPIGELEGAELVTVSLSDQAAISALLAEHRPDTIISCIASRSGSPKDAMAVDYEANVALLKAALASQAKHFILLSAICVQRPKLAFQRAKLAFEQELIEASIDHTIIRPTAFFKSLSGQVEKVARGKPFMMFGDGELTRCKPISDGDLGRFIALAVLDPARRGKVLPIGGPGPAISPEDQREMLGSILGKDVPAKYVWPAMLDRIGGVFTFLHSFSPLGRDWLAEKAEYMRIAKYYATESMLLLDPETGEYSEELTPEFGEDHLSDHYMELLEARV
ncbi:MAG: NAD(P)H-binding protein [Pseudomonadota bacterium]